MDSKIKLTLSVDEQLLRKYKKYCKEQGLVISRRVEKFIENELERVW